MIVLGERMINNYKYPWKHPKNERPQGCCYDCKMPYHDFPDMVIDDDLWELISPTYWQGAGLLCPTCMANRLNHLGLWYKDDLFLLKKK
jgi:hypothetical protein